MNSRILILGGGFGGLDAVRYLDRTLGRRDNIEVKLVSRENFSLFTPMLHEVIVAMGVGSRLRCGTLTNTSARVKLEI
jgi:NADH dehydrogenase